MRLTGLIKRIFQGWNFATANGEEISVRVQESISEFINQNYDWKGLAK